MSFCIYKNGTSAENQCGDRFSMCFRLPGYTCYGISQEQVSAICTCKHTAVCLMRTRLTFPNNYRVDSWESVGLNSRIMAHGAGLGLSLSNFETKSCCTAHADLNTQYSSNGLRSQRAFCLSLLSARITGVCLHIDLSLLFPNSPIIRPGSF